MNLLFPIFFSGCFLFRSLMHQVPYGKLCTRKRVMHLRLMFENASWLGSSRRQVPWEQINDGLFDRIARFIVREDDSLFTEELPDALRQRLRKDQEPAGQAAVQAPAQPPAPVAADAAKISS